ncbi:hypothetical protein JC777_00200 (plasmid) [Bacillus cytotoxicus]|uniref:Uncharacterized protein n=1 Tax=Bacillus cytotoxicus TaxID=580165 RepID=A0AAX2CNS6_9BACI|nr:MULTISPECIES: hypothetical protein [Bacillus cereus group]MDH2882463.1 hypothetical protein [Bacillus cytotoxicus]QTR81142.1 hypothetical protein JC777_00200 [Bacillus cytotoxicus]QTR87915.1 hypothetical protein JC774_05185 [Bacillus cytotoxicus]SCM08441.1 Uncharacterized protein BCB44BAC_04603 [Bacillus cytotoxicus]HDR4573325.1 hypothetical protein [Bacillus cytotoxicus]
MDIKAIENSVQAVCLAEEQGILGVYLENEVHVRRQLLEKLLNEEGELEVVKRDDWEFSFQVNFKRNGFIYFSLYTAKEFKNTFGGNINECITTK